MEPQPQPEPEPESIVLTNIETDEDIILHLQSNYPQNQINYNNYQLGSTIQGSETNEQSGYSVDLNSDGSILAIGSIDYDSKGRVRVYGWNDSSDEWHQIGSDIEGQQTDEDTGYSVSLSSDGTILAVGAVSSFETVTVSYSGNTFDIRVTHGEVRVYKYANIMEPDGPRYMR